MKKIKFVLCAVLLCAFGNMAYAYPWRYNENRILNYGDGEYSIYPGKIDKIKESELTDLEKVNGPRSGYVSLKYPIFMRGSEAYLIHHANCGQSIFFRDANEKFVSCFTILPNIYSSNKGYIGYKGTTLVMYYKNVQAWGNNQFGKYDVQLEFYKNGTIKIAYFGGKNWEEYSGIYKHLINWGTSYTSFDLENYLENCEKISNPFTNGNNGFIIKNNVSKATLSFNQLAVDKKVELLYSYTQLDGNSVCDIVTASDQIIVFENVDISKGILFSPIVYDVDSTLETSWLIDGELIKASNAIKEEGQDFTYNLVKKNQAKFNIELNDGIEGGSVSSFPVPLENLSDINEGTCITLEAEPKEGYEFVSWEGNIPDKDKTNNILYLTVNSDYDLNAFFRKKTHKVTTVCEPQDAAVIGNTEQVVELEGTVVSQVVPKDGWRVKSWSLDGLELYGTEMNEFTLGGIKQDHTLKIKLVEDAIKVNILDEESLNGVVEIYPNSETYEKGDIITIKAIANEGYRFARWEGVTEDNYSNPLVVKLESDLNVKPVFEKLDCTLTLKVGANGKVRSDCGDVYGPGVYSLEYSAFDTPSFTAVPNTGYFLNSWSGDVSSGYTTSGTAICNELTTGTNSVNVSFYQREGSKGDWNVDSATGDVIIDPVTGITELRGDGMDSSYEFIPEGAPVLNKHSVEFRVKFPEFYSVSVYCTTDEGEKCVTYTGDSEGYYAEDSDNVVYGLGENTMGSGWFTRTKNILVDLQVALGNTALQLESIDKMVFCGNGFVDYIKFVGDNDFPENWSRYTSVRLGQVRNMEDSSIGKYFELYGPEEDYTYQASKYKPQLSAVSGFDVNWKMKYNPGELYRIVFRCIGDDGAVYFVAYTNDSRSFRGEETRFSVKNGDQYWAYKLLPDNEYGNWEEIIANLQETLLEAAPSDLPVSLQLTEIDHLYVRYHNICMTAPEFDAL